jgi:hypothetical protein
MLVTVSVRPSLQTREVKMTLRQEVGEALMHELASKGHGSVPTTRAELDDYLLTAVQALTAAIGRIADAVDELNDRSTQQHP